MALSERSVRPLPEMPGKELRQLERLVGSNKVEERQRAIGILGEMPAYREVPELMRQALDRTGFREWEGIDFNSVMIGVKTLEEFSGRFGVGSGLSYEETAGVLRHLDPYSQIEGWVWLHWHEVGVWGVNVFMGLFGRMSTSVVHDRLEPWFERIAPEIPKDKREWMAKNFVDLLLSAEKYRFSSVFEDYNPFVGDAVRALANLSEEAVPMILGRIGNAKPGDEGHGGQEAFWTATKVLCESRDKRTVRFLRRVLNEAPEYYKEIPRRAIKKDIGEALVAMGEEV